MKKSLALLIAIILAFGIFVSCASEEKAAASPDKDAALALYEECKVLKGQVPEAQKTKEDWTKGVAIFSMQEGLIEKELYTEALPGLGQVKKFWSGLVK